MDANDVGFTNGFFVPLSRPDPAIAQRSAFASHALQLPDATPMTQHVPTSARRTRSSAGSGNDQPWILAGNTAALAAMKSPY